MICSKKARTRREQPANPSLTLVASVLKPPHDTSTLRCVAEPVLSLSNGSLGPALRAQLPLQLIR